MALPMPQKNQTDAGSEWQKPNRILKEWATRMPRFLFRGFHAASGGGSETSVQNSTKGIIPHLFGGAKPRMALKNCSTHSGLRDLSPYEAIKFIKAHLGKHLEPTPFNSRTSDYQTALLSAIETTNGDYELFVGYPDLSRRHIAILDTTRLVPDTVTELLQVFALREAELADADHPCYFLIYGPVKGTAFRAVPLSDIPDADFSPRDRQPDSEWTEQLIKDTTLRARRVDNRFRYTFDKTPDVILAVLAAELSRQRAPRFNFKVSDMFEYRWKDEEVKLIVGLLKEDIASLRLDNGGKTALVNRSMRVHNLPQLYLATKLLEAFMDAAWNGRWPLPPQGHLNPTIKHLLASLSRHKCTIVAEG